MPTEIKFDLDEVVERLANYPKMAARTQGLEAQVIALQAQVAGLQQLLRDTAHNISMTIRQHLDGKPPT